MHPSSYSTYSSFLQSESIEYSKLTLAGNLKLTNPVFENAYSSITFKHYGKLILASDSQSSKALEPIFSNFVSSPTNLTSSNPKLPINA